MYLIGVSCCLRRCLSQVFQGYMLTSAVGYSGVLFALAVVEAFHTTEAMRSVFGLFSVPAKLHPFLLLILLQIIIRNISFFGHLSGIIFGLICVTGCNHIFLLSNGKKVETEITLLRISRGVSADGFQALDDSAFALWLSRYQSFVRYSGKSYATTSPQNSFDGFFAVFSYVLTGIGNFVHAVCYVIGCGGCVDGLSRFCRSFYLKMSNLMSGIVINVNPPSTVEMFGGVSHRLVRDPPTNRDYEAVPVEDEFRSNIEKGLPSEHDNNVNKAGTSKQSVVAPNVVSSGKEHGDPIQYL